MLGLELQRRGHEVVVATEQRMEPLVQQLGQGKLGYFKISGDPTVMIYGKKNQVHRGSELPQCRTRITPQAALQLLSV
jgi:UDP:flavonoid glycosyltransferase YjiC (YdhE family)